MLEVLRQNPGLPVNDHVPDIVSCLLSPVLDVFKGCEALPNCPGRPGHWRRGQEGELDETRLVDALAGEAMSSGAAWVP